MPAITYDVTGRVQGTRDAAIEALATASLQHVHNRERWLGLLTPQTADNWAEDNLAPFVLTSGNNEYGAAVQVLGPEDTPIQVGASRFDLHRLFITAVSVASPFKLRIVYGDDLNDAIAAGQFSEDMVRSDAANPQQATGGPSDILMPALPSGTKVWMQAWNATNGATISLFVGLHEYPA